ncbi:hypothetical protein SprV_0100355200 [Sparganum proliferum]
MHQPSARTCWLAGDEIERSGCRSAEVIRTEERFGSHSLQPAPSSRNTTPSTLSPTSVINVPSNLSSPLQTATTIPQFPLQVSSGGSEPVERSGNSLNESEERRPMEISSKDDTPADLLDVLLSSKKTNENEAIFVQDSGQTESLDLSRISVPGKDSKDSPKTDLLNPFETADQKGRELLSFMTALAASGSLFGRPTPPPAPLLSGSNLLDETAFTRSLGQEGVERSDSSAATAPPPPPAQRKCHICSDEIPDSMPEYMKHLTLTHLMPAPMALITSFTVYRGVDGLESNSDILKSPQTAVARGDFSCVTSSALSCPMPVPPALLNPDAISGVSAGCDLSNLLNNTSFSVPLPSFWPNFNIPGDLPRRSFDHKIKDRAREPPELCSLLPTSLDSLKASFSTDPLGRLEQRRIPAFPLGAKNMFGLGFNSLCEHLPASLMPRQSPETAFPLQPTTVIHSASGLQETSGDCSSVRNWDEAAMGAAAEPNFKRPRLETSGLDPFHNPNQLSSPSGPVHPPPCLPAFPPGFMYRPLSSLLERGTAAVPTNPNFPKPSAKVSKTGTSTHSDQSPSATTTRGSGLTATVSSTSGPTTSGRRNASSMEEGGNGQPTAIVHNTLRKTKSDMKVIHRYFVQVKNDTREIHEMPPEDLSNYIQDFILTAKKKDGHEYEPESLKAFVHSLERHLKYHNYPHSVLKDPAFASARLVLSQRLNELRALSQANGGSTVHSGRSAAHGRNSTSAADECSPFKAAFLSEKYRSGGDGGGLGIGKLVKPHLLMQNGLLGFSNPQAILNSVWLIVRTQLNIVGTQKHRSLTWGQFQLVTNGNSQELLRFTSRSNPPDVRYCQGHGGPLSGRLFNSSGSGLTGSTSGRRQPLPFNCVEAFHYYIRLRPLDCSGPDDPLYLCPDPAWERGGPWFRSTAAGAQLISRIPRLLGLKPAREVNQPPKRPEAEMQLTPTDGTSEGEPLLSSLFLPSNIISSYRNSSTASKSLPAKSSLLAEYGNGLLIPPTGTYSNPLKLIKSEADEHPADTVPTPGFTFSSFGSEREDRFPTVFSTQGSVFPPPNFGSLSLFAAAAAAAAAAASSTKTDAPADIEPIGGEGGSVPSIGSRRTPVKDPTKSPYDCQIRSEEPDPADPVATLSSPGAPVAASAEDRPTSSEGGNGVDLRQQPTPPPFSLTSP